MIPDEDQWAPHDARDLTRVQPQQGKCLNSYSIFLAPARFSFKNLNNSPNIYTERDRQNSSKGNVLALHVVALHSIPNTTGFAKQC